MINTKCIITNSYFSDLHEFCLEPPPSLDREEMHSGNDSVMQGAFRVESWFWMVSWKQS